MTSLAAALDERAELRQERTANALLTKTSVGIRDAPADPAGGKGQAGEGP